MNRRGFLGLVTAAAVVPQELIRAPAPAPLLDAAAAGSAYSRILAQSMLATRETMAANVLSRGFMSAAAFRAAVEPMLNEVFTKAYSEDETDWESLFEENPKTLAGEVGSGDSSVLPWREKARSTAQDSTLASRGAGSIHNPVGAFEGAEENLRKRG